MAVLEVKRTTDGKVLARRADGQPLTTEERERVRRHMQTLGDSRECWNCGALMTGTEDIHGRAWWVCWACAVTV